MNTSSIRRPVQDLPEKSTEAQVNRACEACRLLKVRCLPDSTSTSVICQRCKKSGRICIYAAPQKRRQRIRTDTRVAELEREIRAMRSILTGGDEPVAERRRVEKETAVVTMAHDVASMVDFDSSTTLSNGEERSSADVNNLSRQSSIPTSQANTPEDGDGSATLIYSTSVETRSGKDFGLLSKETSNQLFESYNNDLVQHYPAVLFPKNICPDDVRRLKPVLFQAVVTAAACQLDPTVFGELFKEMTKVYAERIFINGEKSLELIQSLLLTSVWYCPPDESCGPSNLHFYQYIHMAATMALDLGIGLAVDKSVVTLDECRSLLACYLNCAGVAMRMRRPNMLQWTGGMNDCLEVLESAPEATILDRRLVAWVRLQNIADDWSKSMGLINPHVELSLKGFERQLQKWKEDVGPGVINVSLVLAYHQDSIYLHESVLESGSTTLVDFNHRIFKPSVGLRTENIQEEAKRPLTAAYVNAVMSCINSSHALLDEFLNSDIPTLRAVPIIHFVRASYATVVIVKLFISASVPSNELSKILDRQILKIDYYIQALLDKLVEAAGPGKLRVPTKWLKITQQVSDWYHKHLMAFGRGQEHNSEETDAQESSCSVNGTACGTNAIKSSWKADFFPTIASLQDHAPRNTASNQNDPQPLHDHSIPQQSTNWSNPSNPLPSASEPPTYAPFLTDPSSEPMADFAPMDFAHDDLDLSFLDIPGVPPGAFNGWMPDDGVGADMSYEPSSANSWGFDF